MQSCSLIARQSVFIVPPHHLQDCSDCLLSEFLEALPQVFRELFGIFF